MNEWEKINERIEANWDEMIGTLRELIAIPSVVSEPVNDMPFGKEVHKAFSYILEKAEEEGFETCNTDNYGGHIQFGGQIFDEDGDVVDVSDEAMGIVGHLDVVPAGNDWDHEPFGGEIEDGKLYGRGAIDDKGPVVSAFYAMKALKEAGVQPAKKIRLILGLDEETNWDGMAYYLSKEKAPDFGFTPDSEFPAIHGEMGILIFDIAKKLKPPKDKGLELHSLKGGQAPNMVPDSARAVLFDSDAQAYEMIKATVASFRDAKKEKEPAFGDGRAEIHCKGVGKSLEITVKGISAHGSTPECGLNAISVMMELLGKLNFVSDDVTDFIDFYNRRIGYEFDAKKLGADFEDEVSGGTVLNAGTVELDKKAIKLGTNIRYPVTFTSDEIYEAIMPALDEYDLGLVKGKCEEPIFIPADDPFIVTLMDIYREYTGDKDSEAVVSGGGTYARMFNNCVAFGAQFPGEPDTMHQKNEYIDLESLWKMTKIYADAIYRLTKEETKDQAEEE